VTVWDKFPGLSDEDALLASRVTALRVPQITASMEESEVWEAQGRSGMCGANSTDGESRASHRGSHDVQERGLGSASDTRPGPAAQIVGVYPKVVYVEESGARQGSCRGMTEGCLRRSGCKGVSDRCARGY
jgi:hypothetical protein